MQSRLSRSVVEVRRRIARSTAHLRFRDVVLRIGRNNSFVTREDLARRYLVGDGIEIGAGTLPLRVPPRARVRYVDNIDRDVLIARAGGDFLGRNLDVSDVPVVDVVDDAQTLATFPDESVDFIIANHVLEHVEDPIGALENFARATRRDGIIFLTLPDARRSFDHLRERTTVEHLLRDHSEGPQTSREQHYAEWAEFIEGIGPEGIPARSAEYAAADAHHHFHVWELDTFLALLGAIDLNCELLHAQLSQKEFAVVLRKR
ncbi:MAG TPA: methyltransferase domain-containing protein [Solirubrobacteraceae bacterium]|nr:methyltransferase domain-containing protein [Solirubrobacteraceae bacterium]